MKKTIAVVLLSGAVTMLTVLAQASSAGNDAADRLQKSADVLRQVGLAGEHGIPDQVLARTKCIVVVPNMIKAAVLVGGKHGDGVATCRTEQASNDQNRNQRAKQIAGARWSAPAFIRLGGASIGMQLGAEGKDLVMLVMNDKGLDELLSSKVELSMEGSVVAGPVGRDATVGSNPALNAEILVYSVSKGLFAGASLEGAVIDQDKEATKALYGDNVSSRQVLTGAVPTPPSAKPFMQAVVEISHATAAMQAKQQ